MQFRLNSADLKRVRFLATQQGKYILPLRVRERLLVLAAACIRERGAWKKRLACHWGQISELWTTWLTGKLWRIIRVLLFPLVSLWLTLCPDSGRPTNLRFVLSPLAHEKRSAQHIRTNLEIPNTETCGFIASVDGRESSVLSHNAQSLCSSKIAENIQITDLILFLGNHNG